MKILVATKRVQDYNVKVRPKSDGSDVDIDGIKMGINPFDENALEEALRIKEKIQSTEILVVSIGDCGMQQLYILIEHFRITTDSTNQIQQIVTKVS